MNRLALDRIDRDHDQAVIEQQHVTGLDFARQRLVVQTNRMNIAEFGARGIEHKFLAGFQHHLALGKFPDADLGALQVGHDGNLAPDTRRDFAHHARTLDVVLCRAMAEIKAHNVDAGANHLLKDGRIAAGGSQGGNDLGGATGHGRSLSL